VRAVCDATSSPDPSRVERPFCPGKLAPGAHFVFVAFRYIRPSLPRLYSSWLSLLAGNGSTLPPSPTAALALGSPRALSSTAKKSDSAKAA
jgi:hypothetical protein